MSGKVEDPRVFVKGVLCAISMMDIPVHDQDSLEGEILERILGADRHIVEETESHGSVPFCMMTRRSHQRKSIIQFSLHHNLDQLQKTSGSQKGGFIRLCTGRGVSVESDSKAYRLLTQSDQCRQESGSFLTPRGWRVEVSPSQEAGPSSPPLRAFDKWLPKSLWTLRMTRVHHMLQISSVLNNPCSVHPSSSTPNPDETPPRQICFFYYSLSDSFQCSRPSAKLRCLTLVSGVRMLD